VVPITQPFKLIEIFVPCSNAKMSEPNQQENPEQKHEFAEPGVGIVIHSPASSAGPLNNTRYVSEREAESLVDTVIRGQSNP
jgi:hypothetical protein